MSIACENVVSAHGSATALNGESLGIFLDSLYFYWFSCLIVHENRQHVQGRNTTTITSFPYFIFGFSPEFYLDLLTIQAEIHYYDQWNSDPGIGVTTIG